MSLSDEQRSNIVAMAEGHALAHCSQGGDFAAELARCQIDGNVNALLRLEGPESVAQYAFALCDRLVGKLRTPTAWPPKPHEPAALAAVEAAVIAPPAARTCASPDKPKPMRFWAIFAVGFACGLAVGIGPRP